MKKLMQRCVLSAAIAGLALTAQAADLKIATINLGRAFDSYYKTIQSTAALKQEAAEVQKERALMVENGRKHEEEWRKLFDKANDQAVSSDERGKSKKAAEEKYAELETDKQSISAFERDANARLTEKERMRRDDIVKEIRGVLDAKARAAGYSLVLDTSGQGFNTIEPIILYSNGQDDLTDAIIKELNAAAPPESLPTNAPATTSTNMIISPSPSK